MTYKVCVLTAGRGSRLEEYTDGINKALIPLNECAVINTIISQFPDASEFVIAVGYKKKQVQDYLSLTHLKIKFNYVEVDNYDQVGSGPGYSLLCCQKAIGDSPFFFVSCDTLWTNQNLNLHRQMNWLAVAQVLPKESVAYCNVLLANEIAISFVNKKYSDSPSSRAFTGLAYIKDFEIFWSGLATQQVVPAHSEPQVICGFEALIQKSSVKVVEINWTDVGTKKNYVQQLSKTQNYDFSKSNEFIYFFNNRVIKFFEDEGIVQKRVIRAKQNPTVFPFPIEVKGQFYAYDFMQGQVLYNFSDESVFKNLLTWLHNYLWTPAEQTSNMSQLCHDFYYKKTIERIAKFNKKYDSHQIEIINNQLTPTVAELLEKVDWDYLNKGHACFIHGDLQPDNIIFNEQLGEFKLLDWRQDFAGQTSYGDIYYDFAKLWGGLNLDYSRIKKNDFKYEEVNAKACVYSIPQMKNHEIMKAELEHYITENNFSVKKVKILVGLIYLNMSPLHHHPFDKMLHALGRSILAEML